MVVLWHRRAWLLYAMAMTAVFLSAAEAFWATPEHHLPGNLRLAAFGARLLNISVATGVLHLAIALWRTMDLRNAALEKSEAQLRRFSGHIEQQNQRLQEANLELEAVNEELTTREEEIGHQNEELRQQSEELEQQAESLLQATQRLELREQMLQAMLSIAADKDVQEIHVLEHACRHGIQLLGQEVTGAAVLEPRGESIAICCQVGVDKTHSQHCWPRSSSFAGLVLEETRPLAIDDMADRPDLVFPSSATGGPFRSIIATRLQSAGRDVGVLEFYGSQPRAWTQEHFRLVQWIAAHCGLVLEIIRLRRELRDSGQQLRLAMEAAQMGSWAYDLSEHVCEYDTRSQALYGVSQARVAHDAGGVSKLICSDDVPRMWEAVRRACDPAGDGRYEVEYRTFDGQGGYRWLSVCGRAEFAGDGADRRAVRIIGISRDVTAARALREERDHLSEQRAIALEAAGMGWWHFDAASLEWTFDERAAAILGVRELPGNIDAFVARLHPEDQPVVAAAFKAATDPANPCLYIAQYRIRQADGSLRWIEAHGRGLFAGEGAERRLVALVGTVADITSRQEAQAQLLAVHQRLESLMRALPVGVSFSADATCQEITGNPELLAQFEVGPQDNVSASAPDSSARGRQVGFYRDGRPVTAAELPMQRAVAENRVIEPMELEIHLPSGRRWFASASGAPIRDASGQVVGGVGVTVDITQRKALEESLRQINAALEDRVAQRTAEARHKTQLLQRLYADLVSAEQRANKHLAQVLHDGLQQLLVAARIRLGLVPSAVCSETREQLLKVDSLLTQAIATSRSLTAELAPPALYERGLEAGLQWLAASFQENHALSVQLHSDPGAETEQEAVQVLLYQATRELLFNIVKHAQVRQAEVWLRKRDQRFIELVVADSGRGFDPSNTQTSARKDGFGLASIRERLESVQGQLQIQSAPGKGTRVTIELPLALPTPQSATAESSPTPDLQSLQTSAPSEGASNPGQGLRVVLADDHHLVREGLAMLLRAKGIDVIGQACDGREAIELAHQLLPDLILMDVTMPHMNGIDATQRIRQAFPGALVIGLSMHDGGPMAQAMRDAGARDCLRKDLPIEDLVAAIQKYCL